ncbi:MAG: NAD-dependent epimerase/dehydratase family protein [Ruminococcus sp.]|jgi:nucleoside-diphosphate-sugar epimerase|nr:NAD-dependent epimerase/dehydratase family protein [Ruminococcus sp.]
MKILFIGGTGTISTAISKKLTSNPENELYLLNRGSRNNIIPGAKEIIANIYDEADVAKKIDGMYFDVVAEFIAFGVSSLERDFRLFNGKCSQFIFISSASAYQKPVGHYLINESTPLCNPYWEYSRNKIACEDYLNSVYRNNGFPITIVRPSHTYDERNVPLGVHGKNGPYQVIKRIIDGKPVILHGDGTSLWTMTHNSDFADAFIGLMGNQKAIGEAVQITSDESISWNQIYDAIGAALGKEVKRYYVPSDLLAKTSDYDFEGGLIGDKANSVVFDNSKVKRLVPGFCAKKPFKIGVKETIDYVLSHPEYQTEDPEFDAYCDKLIEKLDGVAESFK